MVHLGPLTRLEINGQDVTDSIYTPEPWATDHQLHVLPQIESRPGPPEADGTQWMERRLTGKVTVVCACGHNTGLIDRADLPPIEELAAAHSPTLAGG